MRGLVFTPNLTLKSAEQNYENSTRTSRRQRYYGR